MAPERPPDAEVKTAHTVRGWPRGRDVERDLVPRAANSRWLEETPPSSRPQQVQEAGGLGHARIDSKGGMRDHV